MLTFGAVNGGSYADGRGIQGMDSYAAPLDMGLPALVGMRELAILRPYTSGPIQDAANGFQRIFLSRHLDE